MNKTFCLLLVVVFCGCATIKNSVGNRSYFFGTWESRAGGQTIYTTLNSDGTFESFSVEKEGHCGSGLVIDGKWELAGPNIEWEYSDRKLNAAFTTKDINEIVEFSSSGFVLKEVTGELTEFRRIDKAFVHASTTEAPKNVEGAPGGTWNRYQTRTLSSVVSSRSLGDTPAGKTINSKDWSSRVVMKYSGCFRPVPAPKKELIAYWLTSIGQSSEIADIFKNEYEFSENGVTYWLPVQDKLAASMKEELREGGQCTLYIVWVGIENSGANPEYVFIVNEFDGGT